MDIYSINVSDIHNRLNQQFEAKLVPYKKVLERIFLRIKYRVEHGYDHLIYEIPNIIMGAPPIDIPVCAEFLKLNLKQRGFESRYAEPNILIVNWPLPDLKVENHIAEYKYNVKPITTDLGQRKTKMDFNSVKRLQSPNSFPKLEDKPQTQIIKVSNKNFMQKNLISKYIPRRQ